MVYTAFYSDWKVLLKPWRFIRNPDGPLFGLGKYNTTMIPDELPEWYIKTGTEQANYYLSAKAIKALQYIPCQEHEGRLRADYLVISYKRPLIPYKEPDGESRCAGGEGVLYGDDIMKFIDRVDLYGNVEVNSIRKEYEKNHRVDPNE